MQENTCATRGVVLRRLAKVLGINCLLSLVCLAADAGDDEAFEKLAPPFGRQMSFKIGKRAKCRAWLALAG